MVFLLTNDDGIDSAGLRALAEALSERADIYVCAPSHQQSGKSHSITLEPGIYIHEDDFRGAKKAWRCDGTPVDCAKAGVQFLRDMGLEPDIVFSGINRGANMGLDTLYSGTVGAAMEAAMNGVKAVAVSVSGLHASHFDCACDLALAVIDRGLKELPSDIVLNINTPDLPREDIKGVRVTRLGPVYYRDRFEDKGEGFYHLEGVVPYRGGLAEDSDVVAEREGWASVTPMRMSFTDESWLEKLRKWSFDI